jgi:hypothetical protein
LIVGVLAMLFSVTQAGWAGGPGTSLAAFLEVDGGTRQMGMGGAFTGMGDDAMTVFYNPAGLRFLRGSEIHFSTSTWPAGVSFQHLAYGFLYKGVPGYFGISWSIMQMGPFKEKNEYFDLEGAYGEPVGLKDNVDAGDMAFGGSYAWKFSDGLSIGTTVRWYHLNIAEAFSEGVCADLGVLYDTRFRNLRLGAAVQNMGPSNRFANTGGESAFGEHYPMPLLYRAGASMRIYDVVTHRVVLAADYKRTHSGANQMNMGTEYTFNRGKVFAYGRAGYRLGYDEEGLTFGLGVKFPSSSEADTRIDYAFVNLKNLDHVHRFSVSFLF